MPWGPYFASLPVDGAGKRYVDQTSWDAMMDNFPNWKAAVNGGGFTLSNAVINTALGVTAGTLAIATNTLMATASQVGMGITIAAGMPAKLHVHNTTADAHIIVSNTAPSIHLTDNAVTASMTMNGGMALATAAGNYGLAAGDLLIFSYGSAHGNIYINPNYSGTGKSTILLGNVGIGGVPAFPLDVLSAADAQFRIGSYSGLSGDTSGGSLVGENLYRDGAGAYRAYVTHGSLGGAGILFTSGLTVMLSYSGASTQGAAVVPTESMRIASGNVLVGYTSSNGAYKLQVNSQIFATSATVATSDGNYKTNVVPLKGALDLVTALNPVSFNWKKHPVHDFDTDTPAIGFIAQEVKQVLAKQAYLNSVIKANECTFTDPATGEERTESFLGIAEGNMIALLTRAVQELNAKVDSLVAR